MDWFLYDKGLRHEIVKELIGTFKHQLTNLGIL